MISARAGSLTWFLRSEAVVVGRNPQACGRDCTVKPHARLPHHCRPEGLRPPPDTRFRATAPGQRSGRGRRGPGRKKGTGP